MTYDSKINLFNIVIPSSSGYYDNVSLLSVQGALREENVKVQYKTISTGTNDNEILADSQKISHSEENEEEEEKEVIYLPNVQDGKEETMFTRKLGSKRRSTIH